MVENLNSSPDRITVIDSMEKMAAMAKPWNDLLAGSRSNAVFLTWEWLYSWAERFLAPNRRLFVLTIYKDGELTGIAPWYIERVRRWGLSFQVISFLGTPETASDYLDVFARSGKEKAVAEFVYRHLLGSTCWDALTLRGIPQDSFFYFYFQNAIEADGKYVDVRPGTFSPFVILPKTEEAYFSRLTPKRRKRFLSDLRSLERLGKLEHEAVEADGLIPALQQLGSLYTKRWGRRGEVFEFLEDFIRHSDGKGRVQIDLLRSDGRPIAGLLHLRHEGIFSMYLMAVDHSFSDAISVGNILVGLSIKAAIREGLSVYDFLAGSQDYKFYWAQSGKRCLDLVFYGKRPKPLIWMVGQTLKSLAKAFVR